MNRALFRGTGVNTPMELFVWNDSVVGDERIIHLTPQQVINLIADMSNAYANYSAAIADSQKTG